MLSLTADYRGLTFHIIFSTTWTLVYKVSSVPCFATKNLVQSKIN